MTFQYDREGRLSKAYQTNAPAQGATYAYDAQDRLASRTVTTATATTTTLYLHDLNDHIIAETDTAGVTKREYLWLDDLPIAVVDNANTATPALYYVHTDHLGRPARMVAQNWAWVWDVIYTPFGGAAAIFDATTKLDMRFPGQWFQMESGLAYNWHRHYDPSLGKYVQPDPIGYAGGRSLYGYVGQNPLAYVDPEGLTFRTNFGFLLQWLLGTGDRERVYFEGSVETAELSAGPGAQKLRDAFYKNGCKTINGVNWDTWWEAGIQTSWQLLDTSGQVGGFGGASAVNKGDGTVTFRIRDVAGSRSFFYHMLPDRRDKQGPMSNITQIFEWTEMIDKSRCQCH